MAYGHAGLNPAGCSEATIPPELVDLEATVAVQAAVIAESRAVNAAQARAIATLEARVAELERRLGKVLQLLQAAVLGWPSKACADQAAR